MGYQVVGLFVIQQEDINSIKEALDILRGWNPEWTPKNFMVDFADEEIQAIEATFPGKLHDYLSVTFGINNIKKFLNIVHENLTLFSAVTRKLHCTILSNSSFFYVA